MLHNNQKNEKGVITLMVIFTVGLFAMATALTVAVGTLSGLTKNRNDIFGDRALAAAEAAAGEGAYNYLSTFSNITHSSPYTGGNFSTLNSSSTTNISVTLDPNGLPYAYITGTAINNLTKRIVVRTISWYPEGEVFDNAMLTQGDINFGGSSLINAISGKASVYSNSHISLSGSSQIDGDAYYYLNPGPNASNVTGFTKKVSQTLPIPTLDLSAYLSAATKVFSSTAAARSYIKNNTNNDLIYVTGTGQLDASGNNTNLTGTLVTSDDLKLSGGVYKNSDNTHPVLIVNGNLDISGGVDITGIVYVTGTTSFSGNNTIRGMLISLGGINSPSGGSTITFDPDIVSDWQHLLGLDLNSSTVPPRVVNWDEK